MKIDSGTGNGKSVKIDDQNRMYVDAITFNRAEEEVERGNGYNINTGVINLTSANKSAVLYMKNNEDDPLVVTALFYMWGTSTGGTGDVLVTMLRNPSAGTIISNAVAAEMAGVNRNFGSNKSLSADIYKGAEGNTFTNGDKVIESLLDQGARRTVLTVGDVVIPKGSSLGIDITPATGNTSLDVEFAISCFIDTTYNL
jgi:hypothetical protein